MRHLSSLLQAALIGVLSSVNETWAQRSHRESMSQLSHPRRSGARTKAAAIRTRRVRNKRARKARLLNTWIRRGKA